MPEGVVAFNETRIAELDTADSFSRERFRKIPRYSLKIAHELSLQNFLDKVEQKMISPPVNYRTITIGVPFIP